MSLDTIRSLLREAVSGTALLALGALALAAPAEAQNRVFFSPDITAKLGSVTPAVVTDNDAATDNAAGTVKKIVTGMFSAIPPNAEIGDVEITNSAVGSLLVLDTTTPLPGLPIASPAEPRDVVRYDPIAGTFSIFFDGSANGVPAGTRIDALALDSASNLLLSFDTTVLLPGVGFVADEDLVRFAGGIYSMVFDGSAQGIDPALDLDAANMEPGSTKLLLSFDGSGTVAGVNFDDEDVLAFDTATLAWAMHFDGSASDPVNWPAADLIALPEPGMGASLTAALSALALLALRRRLSSRTAPKLGRALRRWVIEPKQPTKPLAAQGNPWARHGFAVDCRHRQLVRLCRVSRAEPRRLPDITHQFAGFAPSTGFNSSPDTAPR
jgi:hypothetical protein